MRGAKEYYEIFRGKSGQYNQLVVVCDSHARGNTFRVFILPYGDECKWNGMGNPPLNKNIIEVYGVVSGRLGWTECYGWIHEGPWVEDFNAIVALKESENRIAEEEYQKLKQQREIEKKQRECEILFGYVSTSCK